MMEPEDLTLGFFTTCQGPCHCEKVIDCGSVAEALEILEVEGWSHLGHKRLCPKCTKAARDRARIWSDLIVRDDSPELAALESLTVFVVSCGFCSTDGKYMCFNEREAGNHFSDIGWTVIWGQVRCPECDRLRLG